MLVRFSFFLFFFFYFFPELLKIKQLCTTRFPSNKIYSAMNMPFSNRVQNIKSNATNWCQNFTSSHLLVNKSIQTANDSLHINNSFFVLLHNSLHLHSRHRRDLFCIFLKCGKDRINKGLKLSCLRKIQKLKYCSRT